MFDPATATLERLLAEAADDATRRHWEAYLKGTARFRGVPMAGVRSAVRRTWREHALVEASTNDLLTLAHRWFAAPTSEDKLAAVLLLAEQVPDRLGVEHLGALAAPFGAGHIADWNVCDWYATKTLHVFLTYDPDDTEPRARGLARWGRAESLWQRRAGLVAFVKLAPRAAEQFEGFTELVLQLCRDNLVSDDRFAHTGPGWVLRELSRSEPDAVRRFVEENDRLSDEARRMALARLRRGRYRRR
ncbi:MAG TPA: DNA alkylation repair protein [Acidimicrobiales bacterium]|nr:DNA alkylation repair protein [Acidimicrobiales bacterium]